MRQENDCFAILAIYGGIVFISISMHKRKAVNKYFDE